MRKIAWITGDAPGRLWGLDSRERLRRQLATLEIPTADALEPLASGAGRVLILDAGYLFEIATLEGLAAHERAVLRCEEDGRVAAAITPAGDAVAANERLGKGADVGGDFADLAPRDLEGYDRQLRRSSPPVLAPITRDARERLEALLYGNAYKGITDLVTKWCWPGPARRVVRWCADAGIRPNTVTLAGALLVVAATLLFWQGAYAAGLASDWLMTFLDTVDGKLARVTVTSSRVGHVLDHGIDLVHPPFWYVAWGVSLGEASLPGGLAAETGCWLVTVAYVAGRLLEALFHQLGDCGVFAWRPFDAYFRLVAARRNPCLIVLTLLLALAGPAMAFVGVVAWMVASTLVLAVRLAQAARVRWQHGPLDAWLKDGERAAREHPRAYATFAQTQAAFR